MVMMARRERKIPTTLTGNRYFCDCITKKIGSSSKVKQRDKLGVVDLSADTHFSCKAFSGFDFFFVEWI